MADSSLDHALSATEARPVLVDARLVRRVIKRHRRLPGVGLQVPHARCYAISRAALLGIVDARELGHAADTLPEEVILLPRPEPDEIANRPHDELLAHLWRYAFHARVHQEIARRALTPARIRERIHRIGQTEFDEIRAVLRHDDLLLARDDDAETYAEFAAFYLELSSFDPGMVAEIFPTLGDAGNVTATLAEDVDVARLLEATRPAGAERKHAAKHSTAPPPAPEGEEAPRADPAEVAALLADAKAARDKGNLVRSALRALKAGASQEARADVSALVARLDRALRVGDEGEPIDAEAWTGVLLALARRAVARGGLFRRVEARMLYDVERVCLASEKAIGKVSVVDWALSLGKLPVARLLPRTREIRVAAELHRAAAKVPRVGLDHHDRARLGELCADARRRAEENIRTALRPALHEAMISVGLKPASVPEQVAFAKVAEELLDQIAAREFTNLGLLRDALSRSQLKLADVTPGEVFRGDALLGADARLAVALDGVHARGEIYLRILQKISSLFFGTGVGRAITFYLVLPFGGAFMLLKGTEIMVFEIGHLLHLIPHQHGHEHHSPLPDPVAFSITAVILFALIHSAAARALVLRLLRAVGSLLAAVFLDLPRWILTRPAVKAILESGGILALRRFVVRPALLAALIDYGTPLHREPSSLVIPVLAAIFVVSSVVLNTRAGLLAEEIALDTLARTARRVARQVLPGLWRLIVDGFRRITNAVDRGIYAVDEWLRFREGQRRSAIAAKALIGVAWFAIAYVIRIYVNLFVEPQINPIKHFPTVTVAAKLMLGFSRQLQLTLHDLLLPVLGAVVSAPLSVLLVAFMPGFFGFLVWELKENYKLYRATRPGVLTAAHFGHHGETMGALLKPGLHSGTVPKLWAKLRRALRKGSASAEKHKEAMREVEEAVERLVDREMCALLVRCDRWQGGHVHVSRVALASNRVRVEVSPHQGAPCVITFEEQSGLLVAGVREAGFTAGLSEGDRLIVENALGGLYQIAGVDLVREQLEAALPAGAAYDIADEGLVVWPAGFGSEIVYPLHSYGDLRAKVRGEPTGSAPPEIARGQIFFHEQPIAWTDWVAAWSGEPKRVVKGSSLLPGTAVAPS